MAILTDTDGQLFRVDGRYALVLARHGGGHNTLDFARLADLAIELSRRHRYSWNPRLRAEVFAAVSPDGKLFNLAELARYGSRLLDQAWTERRYPGYVRRSGAVFGIHCYRGGSSYFRRISTTGERRLGALVVTEDGEVTPRAARNPSNIPNSWHDFGRTRDRSWKAQHRGRKAWDRERHGGKEGAR